ncbi:putative RNA-dependent RNA polymerase [Lachnellula willkommii]|uniref:RNA-dependent RNA polymerase n=1 Tax=Lachnellula willkommii TaxID=215461 RepID=A0A559M4K1_9HELO|nr:putative RNA-dependent RNA polymerase [Lachnellula willkommii]
MASASTSIIPSSPPKNIKDVECEIELIIGNLNHEWELNLPMPKEVKSPDKRGDSKEQKCFNMIFFLAFRKQVIPPVREFIDEADNLYTRWVIKPKAERGVVPEKTRHRPKPVTPTERSKLLHMLFTLLREKSEAIKSQHAASPLRWRTSFQGENSEAPKLDDSPVPFPKLRQDPKRARDGPIETSPSKKVKTPEKTEVLAAKNANTMLPPPRGRAVAPEPKGRRSANTSFESNATSSVFSQSMRSMQPDTQETVPDLEETFDRTQEADKEEPGSTHDGNHTSSEFNVGSSFEAALAQTSDPNGFLQGSEFTEGDVEDELSQDVMDIAIGHFHEPRGTISNEDILKERLEDIFPPLPPGLNSVSFAKLYEITRVFLYAGESLVDSGLQALSLNDNNHDYELLWKDLKDLPVLKDKEFPEKSERVAWNAAQVDERFQKGPHGLVFSGSLRFNESSPTGPFFQLQLKPMKLDLSHRLGRRLGADRFLELDVPHLSGRGIPKILQDLGDQGRELVIDHLVDGTHRLFGRTWKPFHCKPKDTKELKRDILKDFNEEASSATAHRVFFFAVDGEGFQIAKHPLRDPSYPKSHAKIDIPALLNMVRPTRKNTHQSYLKLFSRTSLALSRNTATVVLERSQVFDEADIRGAKNEDMTDGAGLMSYTLAQSVAKKLGLSYLPSGFQGRLGEGKGFWTVDPRDRSGKDWIKVYESQQKWKRSQKRGGESDDPSHLTFEVNRPSGPLKSAALNLQLLPLLVDRAINKPDMKKAIAELLRQGLMKALTDLQAGMDDAPSLREWTGESNTSIKEKVKAGQVPFRAGMPSTIEERLNLMLDSGFQPNSLRFIQEMTRNLLKNKCDELKDRLNITVGKSTYAYMVPDFWGVLEPDEVYIDFSNFVDDVSGFTGVRLNKGEDVLVARSPAHFVSDVQKVRVVVKPELWGLENIIVFPTKAFPGEPSLAQKLSGGDYDGDLAWVCWEPSIVDNFEAAKVPDMPDLVKEGYITQDSTKYKDLVKGQKNPVSFFLRRAFSFNMQESMLGKCTAFKEAACYSDKSASSLSSRAAIYMSTLLSSLVDQAKQGYSFDEAAFLRFKAECVHIVPSQPLYKTKQHLDRNAKHIIDYLMFVAHETVNAALTEFHQSLEKEKAPQWDDDLAEVYKIAREEGKKNDEWKRVLDQLDADLKPIREEWTRHFARRPKGPLTEESMPAFTPIRDKCFELYQAIKPQEDTPLTQALFPKNGRRHADSKEWALLKASALFSLYRKDYVPAFVWWMAGKQLCTIKANCSENGAPHAVAPAMMRFFKMNKTIVKLSKAADSSTRVVELEDIEDDE